MDGITRISRRLSYLLLFLLLSFPGFAWASFDALSVYPMRVVIEDGQRSGQVTLLNTGKETTRYRISFIDMVLDEYGTLTPVTSVPSGHLSARKMLRYSPRNIQLKPGESQIIRVLTRMKRSLADGEYRSYMLVQAVPLPGAKSTQSSGMSMRVQKRFGISMPVIVRKGSLTVSAKPVKATLGSSDAGKPQIQIETSRQGERSLYGQMRVDWIRNGTPTTVAELVGIALYTPYEAQSFALNLSKEAKGIKAGEQVRVRLLTMDKEEHVLFDETIVISR